MIVEYYSLIRDISNEKYDKNVYTSIKKNQRNQCQQRKKVWPCVILKKRNRCIKIDETSGRLRIEIISRRYIRQRGTCV